jgi:hypothetical protein
VGRVGWVKWVGSDVFYSRVSRVGSGQARIRTGWTGRDGSKTDRV